MLLKQIRTAVVGLIAFSILTGIFYPLLITGIAQLFFPEDANGSLIKKDGKTFGSDLIGQSFSKPEYFWGRLSATGPFAYNAAASSGSNYGPLNPALVDAVKNRVKQLQAADPQNASPIPVDLVTASGSGLDPHISIAAALYQAPRVARARGMSESMVRKLIDQFTESREFGILGEPGVNFLQLNLALNDSTSSKRSQ